ncbi:8571_t:CDS:2 [Entrophospora sp. SA101]|nr:8571_t:CDS:2 [Entrophospora sp. SA101]
MTIVLKTIFGSLDEDELTEIKLISYYRTETGIVRAYGVSQGPYITMNMVF